MLKEKLFLKGLSTREVEVAGLVATGLTNKIVAAKLFVTEKTIKFHLTNVYKKLQLKSRSQLIVFCLPLMGFVEVAPAETNQAVSENPDFSLSNGDPILPGSAI